MVLLVNASCGPELARFVRFGSSGTFHQLRLADGEVTWCGVYGKVEEEVQADSRAELVKHKPVCLNCRQQARRLSDVSDPPTPDIGASLRGRRNAGSQRTEEDVMGTLSRKKAAARKASTTAAGATTKRRSSTSKKTTAKRSTAKRAPVKRATAKKSTAASVAAKPEASPSPAAATAASTTEKKPSEAVKVAMDLLSKNGGEMKVSELARDVIASGRVTLKGKTPAATVGAQIYVAAKAGRWFRKTERGKVALAK